MSAIALRDVWKVYQLGGAPVEAIKGITITIDTGECVAVTGPSGSGKSTCMNLIGCLDTPTKGEVFLGNTNISSLSDSQLAHIRGKKIGFVFQQFHLIKTMSAKENVMLPLMFQGTKERERRAKELLALTGLSHRMDHRPSELSGGEQQRVAIARALANDPDIILADEPTGNLDSSTGETIMNLLQRLHHQGKTLILVTHDARVAKLAQKVYALKDGKVVKNYAQ